MKLFRISFIVLTLSVFAYLIYAQMGARQWGSPEYLLMTVASVLTMINGLITIRIRNGFKRGL